MKENELHLSMAINTSEESRGTSVKLSLNNEADEVVAEVEYNYEQITEMMTGLVQIQAALRENEIKSIMRDVYALKLNVQGEDAEVEE